MKRSAARSGVYAVIAACGGLAFGTAACFAIAFFFIIFGCPEPRGQVCEDAANLATSIAKVWYLFAVPMGAAAGIAIYFVTRKGSLSLRSIVAPNIVARILVYLSGVIVFLLSILIASIAGFITYARADVNCPAESAYECTEANLGEITLGTLIVAIALLVAISSVVMVYRFTQSNVDQ